MLALGLTVPAVAAEAPEYEMTTYQLLFVVRNPDFEKEEGISDAHSAHRNERIRTASNLYLRNLVNDDVSLIAGPLVDEDRIVQVAVFEAESAAEVERLLAESPAIQTGRYKLEIYPWWAAKDILRKPRDPDDTRVALLGLLKRPADAPSFSEEELERLQAGHLENIGKMADSGDLVIAGPVYQGGALRGILIFRTRDMTRVEELVARDPAIQAGRLELELYRWRVPKRSWPPLQDD
jgi:uncharacterized protein YciI